MTAAAPPIPAPAPAPVVAIDGIDGSGKSTFGRRLVAELRRRGGAPAVIRVDDFRRPVDWARRDKPEAELYYDEYYDFALLDRCLRATAAVEIPRFDVARERLVGTRLLDLRGDLIVVEGVFPLRCAAVRAGTLVYLVTTPEEARRRILERDQRRGRTREDVEHRIAARYFPGQRRYHARFDPEGTARVVVDNEAPAAPRIVRFADVELPPRVADAIRAVAAAPAADGGDAGP